MQHDTHDIETAEHIHEGLPQESVSAWIASGPDAPRFPKFTGALDVDVVIVGAGITGLTSALLLLQAGKRVAVLDARRIAEGESANTTAHLTQVTDARVHTLVKTIGPEKARLVWNSGKAAIDWIEELVRAHAIDCDFYRVPGFLYTDNAGAVAELREEYNASMDAKIPVTWIEGGFPLPYGGAAALRYDDQAKFHVRKYLVAIAELVVAAGGRIFENSPALEIHERPKPHVKTADGEVTARDVIVAANVPINNRVLLQTKIAHYRSYAIAARLADQPPLGLYWDTQDPYHYIRSQEINGEWMLVVGGEDHRTGQDEDTRQRFENLATWTRARFFVSSIDYRWSGQIIVPVDGLPYIGRNTMSEHVFEATGFGGNGMTFGTFSAMLLSDLILNRPNSCAEIYDATRITPIASASNYVRENLDFPKHFVGDRLKRAPDHVSELAPGDGKILEIEGHKMAVYRNENGSLTYLSPVCTHLRCIVEFNKAEKSWDCPCHGSRFDVDGKVLNGPAIGPLKQL